MTLFTVSQTADRIEIVLCVDKLEAGNAGQFKDEIVQLPLRQTANVVVDISRLQYIDSSGIGALLSLLKALPEPKGNVTLLNPSRTVRSILELVRMHRIFTIA